MRNMGRMTRSSFQRSLLAYNSVKGGNWDVISTTYLGVGEFNVASLKILLVTDRVVPGGHVQIRPTTLEL
jgi:hypothetical protein